MNGKDRLNRLDLDDHGVVDEHINAVSDFDSDSLVHDGKDLLALDLHAHSDKLIPKAFPVGPLKKPWPQSRVHPVGGTQNAIGSFAVYQPCLDSVRVRAL